MHCNKHATHFQIQNRVQEQQEYGEGRKDPTYQQMAMESPTHKTKSSPFVPPATNTIAAIVNNKGDLKG